MIWIAIALVIFAAAYNLKAVLTFFGILITLGLTLLIISIPIISIGIGIFLVNDNYSDLNITIGVLLITGGGIIGIIIISFLYGLFKNFNSNWDKIKRKIDVK